MSYIIDPGWFCRHRDSFLDAIVMLDCFAYYGDIDVVIIKLLDDQKWYITPSDYDEEHLLDDVGPFDDPEDAIIMLKLTASNIERREHDAF